ncbi:MAG: metal-sulfur cluster assembly factor [Candidatus Bipolaricaulia bacterium]
MVDKDQVWKKLEKVEDPEFRTSVVEMDLIDEVSIDGDEVSVEFHLTAPVCPPPFVLNMAKQIKKYVSELEGVSQVEVTVKEHNKAEELNQKLKNMEV